MTMPSMPYTSYVFTLIAAFGVAITGTIFGAERPVPKSIETLITIHCAHCHQGEDAQQGIDLTRSSTQLTNLEHSETLDLLYSAIKRRKMPPTDAAPLSESNRQALLSWLMNELTMRAKDAQPTQPVARRLTNFEYQNTIRDLVGFEVYLIDDLPKDPVAPYRFNNTAEFMRMGPEQFNRYLEAARKVMASAIVNPEPPEIHKTRVEWQPHGTDRGLGADEVGVWGNRRNTPATGMGLRSFPPRGEFLIRIQASAILPLGVKEIPLRLVMGYNLNENSSTLRIRPVGTISLTNTPDEPQTFEFRGRIENFPAQPGRVVNDKRQPDKLTITFQNLYDDGTLNDDQAFLSPRNIAMPRAVINWAEFEGPVFDSWPPSHHTRILFESPLRESAPDQYVAMVLERFMSRAYRRPVSKEEVQRIAKIYDIVRPQLPSFEAAMRETLAMVLVSPQFMYHAPEKNDTHKDYALASRLSYFLWGTMPDESLQTAAANNQLSPTESINNHVQRMLTDRSRTLQFLDNFSTQWLGLSKLHTVPINRDLFPRFLYYVARGERAGTEVPYRPTIRDYMVDETVYFMHDLLTRNQSLLQIVDSDFAMLNQPLAYHYGIPGIQGHNLQRVKLPPDSPLGGILSQGSILIANSTGSAPHPIYRAVWLREAILGDEVPEPPADVPALSDTAGESADSALTIGQLLKQHRQKESCNACHASLDPWGLPFERYNSIGRFQPLNPKEGTRVSPYSSNTHGDMAGYQRYLDSINTKEVLAHTTLPTGVEIDGLPELKSHLIDQHSSAIAENLIRRLTSYALGRELTWRDTPAIENLVNRSKQVDYNLRDTIVLICQSELFHPQILP